MARGGYTARFACFLPATLAPRPPSKDSVSGIFLASFRGDAQFLGLWSGCVLILCVIDFLSLSLPLPPSLPPSRSLRRVAESWVSRLEKGGREGGRNVGEREIFGYWSFLSLPLPLFTSSLFSPCKCRSSFASLSIPSMLYIPFSVSGLYLFLFNSFLSFVLSVIAFPLILSLSLFFTFYFHYFFVYHRNKVFNLFFIVRSFSFLHYFLLSFRTPFFCSHCIFVKYLNFCIFLFSFLSLL